MRAFLSVEYITSVRMIPDTPLGDRMDFSTAEDCGVTFLAVGNGELERLWQLFLEAAMQIEAELARP